MPATVYSAHHETAEPSTDPSVKMQFQEQDLLFLFWKLLDVEAKLFKMGPIPQRVYCYDAGFCKAPVTYLKFVYLLQSRLALMF